MHMGDQSKAARLLASTRLVRAESGRGPEASTCCGDGMGGDRTLERSKGAGSSPGWLPIKAAVGRLQCRRNKVLGRIEPPMLVVMELVASNIQVLLQAAEYLERREREAEHGYASLSPHCGRDARQSRRRPKPRKAVKSLRSAHNELEKHRRAQLRHCLEQLKQQIPMNTEHSRYTTLNLLHRARLHIKKLEDQEEKARRQKERLRSEQRNLHQRLGELLAHSSVERPRADSLDSSRFSSEHSDSEDAEVDVEGLAFISTEEDVVAAISTGQEHSYSNTNNVWL